MISNSVFKLSVLALGTVALVACSNSEKKQIAAESYVDWVDPLIGSGGHGHVFVGASIPHGMIQLGPNNNKKGYSLMRIKQIDNELINLGYLEETDTGEIILSKKYWKECYDIFEQKKTDISDTIYKSRYVKRDLKQLPPQEIEALREREFLKIKKKRRKRKKRVSRKKYRLHSRQNRKSA